MMDVLAAYSLDEWVRLLAFGGFVGALGQGARTIVGLKKINDATSGQSISAADVIVTSRLFSSLAIGFIAGAFAAVSIVDPTAAISGEQLFALAAAGYAGTDAIEGLIKRASGSTAVARGEEVVGIRTSRSGEAAPDHAVSDAVG